MPPIKKPVKGYKVLIGLDTSSVRYEPGDSIPVSALSETAAASLLDQRVITDA